VGEVEEVDVPALVDVETGEDSEVAGALVAVVVVALVELLDELEELEVDAVLLELDEEADPPLPQRRPMKRSTMCPRPCPSSLEPLPAARRPP
jgi:hypothetical protein